MRSRVMPGSSVTIERRCPMIRLNNVDLPTLGRPTMAIRGSGKCMKSSGENVGFRIGDFGLGEPLGPRLSNPKSEIGNPQSLPLSFGKISHQRIWHLWSASRHLWDLLCLMVIYSKITATIRNLKTYRSEALEAAMGVGQISGLFFAPATWGKRPMSV